MGVRLRAWTTTGCLLAALPAASEVPPRPEAGAGGAATLVALDIPIKQLVGLVSAEHDLRPNVSERLRGTVKGTTLDGSLEEMLTAIATQVPIDWFTHSDILYVSSPDEEIVQFLPLRTLSLASVQELLAQSDLDYSRHVVEPLTNEAAIKVVGPPTMVELIEAMVQLSSEAVVTPYAQPSVRVRRGTDRSIEYHGSGAIMPVAAAPPADASAAQPVVQEDAGDG